jgi:hypothetical protein
MDWERLWKSPLAKLFDNHNHELSSGNSKVAPQPQQRQPLVFPPDHCQLGGASQANRRINCQKFRILAALLVLPAIRFGGNFALCAIELRVLLSF